MPIIFKTFHCNVYIYISVVDCKLAVTMRYNKFTLLYKPVIRRGRPEGG